MQDEQSVYDKDADQRPLHHTPATDDELRQVTGIDPDQEAAHEREAYNGAASDIGDKAGLNGKGSEKNKDGKGADDLNFNEDDDSGSGRFGRLRRGQAKVDSLKNKAGKLSQKKIFVGSAIGIGGLTMIALGLLILAIGPYKIVDLAEHISVYQFARVSRTYAENAGALERTRLGIATSDDSLFGKVAAKYADTKYVVSGTYAIGKGTANDLYYKLTYKYSPDKIIANYENTSRLQYVTEPSKIPGRPPIVKKLVIDGVSADIQPRISAKNLIPGYKFVKSIQQTRDFSSTFNQALKADDIGFITRGKIFKQIRQRLGAGLTAWVIGKFLPKNANATEAEATTAAAVAEERATAAAADGTSPTAATTPGGSELDGVASDVEAAERASLADDTKAAEMIKNPGEPSADAAKVLADKVQSQTIGQSIKDLSAKGILKGAISFANPLYNVAVPFCLVYDGSMVQSGPSIDKRNQESERVGLHKLTEADQLKDGTNVNAEAVGAANDKAGDISTSVAERRAAGETVSTSTYNSDQASDFGNYSLSLSDVLPTPFDSIAGAIGPQCPKITSLVTGGALAAANIAATVFTGGAADAASGVGDAAATAAVETVVPKLTTRVIGKLISSGVFVKEFGTSVVKQVTVVEGLTLLSKAYILSHAGTNHPSTAVGDPINNQGDAGVNAIANEQNQQQNYGAPMTDASLQSDAVENQNQITLEQSRKSTFDRYFALTNPDSFLTHTGLLADAYVHKPIISSLLRMGAKIFNPISSLFGIFGSLASHSAFADEPVTSANTYYGNVQFGYTAEEEQLRSTDAYSVLENQNILAASGQVDYIAQRYSKCFDGSESIGTMLSNGDIQRDTNGSVIANQGLCSPDNLGPHNNDTSNDGHALGDLVFRWRLEMGYNNAINQLIDAQDVTK